MYKRWWIGVGLMAAMMLPEMACGQELTRSIPMIIQDEHSTIREVGMMSEVPLTMMEEREMSMTCRVLYPYLETRCSEK